MKHHPLSWFPMSPATFSIIQIKQIPPSLPLNLILSSINIKKIKKKTFLKIFTSLNIHIFYLFIYILSPHSHFLFSSAFPHTQPQTQTPPYFPFFYIKYSNLHVRRNDNVQKSPPYLSTPRLHLSPH